jgi:type II secretory pathway pseudopilin PulG
MTLIELLVVLIIIGILGAVTLRAMDATRERANYEKTFKTLERLAYSVSGNPNLVADGRRTDFGFVGDVGRLPASLDELRTNIGNNPSWNGPYVRLPFVADENSYKTDAWGQEIQYLPDQATLISLANGHSPVTYRIATDTTELTHNSIRGSVSDRFGNVPGSEAVNMRVRLWLPDPNTGQPVHHDVTPDNDGRYLLDAVGYAIPVGTHQLVAVHTGAASESLIKWVTVTPRVGAIVDFRLNNAFTGRLQYISGTGTAYPDPTYDNVTFEVFNTGPDLVHIDSIYSLGTLAAGETAYCEVMRTRGVAHWNYSVQGGNTRAGPADASVRPLSYAFAPRDSLAGAERLRVDLLAFKMDPQNVSPPRDMRGRVMRMRFSDGSIVSFTTP